MKKLLIVVFLGLIVYFTLDFFKDNIKLEQNYIDNVLQNYAQEVDEICRDLDLPSVYFKALIVLECSGRKPAESRFEPAVYRKLQEVQQGSRNKYSGLVQRDLRGFSDSELKDLSTSWGALQIMGYHTIKMNISLAKLKRGEGLYESINWCKQNYGQYLKRKDYKNAFHMHNAGRPYPKSGSPKTYDPDYVPKGLAYLKVFEPK